MKESYLRHVTLEIREKPLGTHVRTANGHQSLREKKQLHKHIHEYPLYPIQMICLFCCWQWHRFKVFSFLDFFAYTDLMLTITLGFVLRFCLPYKFVAIKPNVTVILKKRGEKLKRVMNRWIVDTYINTQSHSISFFIPSICENAQLYWTQMRCISLDSQTKKVLNSKIHKLRVLCRNLTSVFVPLAMRVVVMNGPHVWWPATIRSFLLVAYLICY